MPREQPLSYSMFRDDSIRVTGHVVRQERFLSSKMLIWDEIGAQDSWGRGVQVCVPETVDIWAKNGGGLKSHTWKWAPMRRPLLSNL